MIGVFSKWKLLLAISAAFALSVSIAYFAGQHIGKTKERARIAEKVNIENQKSEKASDEVAKEVQKFNDTELNRELCALGIVRQNRGCE